MTEEPGAVQSDTTEKDDSTKSKGLMSIDWGCMLKPLLIGLTCLVGAGFLFNDWMQQGAGGRMAAVALTVVGTLILLPLLIYIVILVFVKRTVNKLTDGLQEMAAGGKGLLDLHQKLYGQTHVMRLATEDDWEDFSPEPYDDAEHQFSALGFRRAGEVVDDTMLQMDLFSPVIRVMIAGDESTGGTTYVGLYDVSGIGQSLEASLKMMFDVTTEFSDGSFLVTNNAGQAIQSTDPEKYHRHSLPGDTPITELVARHEEEKARMIAANPDLHCVVMRTLDDTLAAEYRQQAIKNEFRKNIGYVDPGEIRRTADAQGADPAAADLTINAVEQAKRDAARE